MSMVPMELIQCDLDLMPRRCLHEDQLRRLREQYANATEDGGTEYPFVAGKAIYDPVLMRHILYDGAHRYTVLKENGASEMLLDVKNGSIDDVPLAAALENHTHGQPYRDEDKRKAILTVLQHPEYRELPHKKLCSMFSIGRTTLHRYLDLAGGTTTVEEDADKHSANPRRKSRKSTHKWAGGLPDHLVPVFEARTHFKHASKLITAALKQVRKLLDSSADRFVRTREVELTLVKAQTDLNWAKPHCPCTQCQGDGCSFCATEGWMNRDAFEGQQQ